MNTIWADTDGVHDDLMDGAALRDWVAVVYDQGAQEIGDPSREELDEALLLRDSLRRLAAFRTDDPRPAAQSPIQDVDEAVAAVNRATTHRPYPSSPCSTANWKAPTRGTPRPRAPRWPSWRTTRWICSPDPEPPTCVHATLLVACCTSSSPIRAASGAPKRAATAAAPRAITNASARRRRTNRHIPVRLRTLNNEFLPMTAE